jgi:arylsulfatase A-like enzyme
MLPVLAPVFNAVKPTAIVHVVADDLGYNDLGYTNGGLTHTPHIDALATSGIQLQQYYTYKVCSPSRASIMTGRYSWGVGYYDMKGPLVVPTAFKLVPELLGELGWRTHAIGKWCGSPPPHLMQTSA